MRVPVLSVVIVLSVTQPMYFRFLVKTTKITSVVRSVIQLCYIDTSVIAVLPYMYTMRRTAVVVSSAPVVARAVPSAIS